MEEKKTAAARRVNLKKCRVSHKILCCKKIIPPRPVQRVAALLRFVAPFGCVLRATKRRFRGPDPDAG
jgi:hypothetical protein